MKAIRLLIFCLAAVPALAQNYHPFIQYGTYRDEFWANELGICTYEYGTRYWFRGDTTVSGQTYQMLLSTPAQGHPNPPFCPPYTVDTSHYTLFALLREDVATQRVYQYDAPSGMEFLWYDFSVNVGDSVSVGQPPQTAYIQDILTETWADGSTHRLIVAAFNDGIEARWMEGLGNINSLWESTMPQCICPHGFCYQQNGVNLYGDVCALAVSTQEPREVWAAVSLTPNPAFGSLNIAMPGGAGSFDRIAVFDLLGRLVVEQNYPAGLLSVDMPVQALPAGSYVVLLGRDGKWLGRQRFQKI